MYSGLIGVVISLEQWTQKDRHGYTRPSFRRRSTLPGWDPTEHIGQNKGKKTKEMEQRKGNEL